MKPTNNSTTSTKNEPKIVFDLVSEIKDLSHFPISYNKDDYIVTLKNGKSSLFSKKTGKLLFPNLWYSNWVNFSNDMYLVKCNDGLKALISKKDGSFIYPDTWYSNWVNFSDDMYLVKRKDGLHTLIYKKDGSFVYPNTWYADWSDFSDDMYRVYTKDNLCTLLYKKDLSFVFKDTWYGGWLHFNDELYIISCQKKDHLVSTLINKKDGTFVYPNLWFERWDDYNEELYIVENEDFLSSFIRKKDGSFVNEDFWFSNLWEFGNNKLKDYLKAENGKGLFYIISAKDYSLVNKELGLIGSIEEFDDEHFLVSFGKERIKRGGRKTLIRMKDFSFVNKDVTFNNIREFNKDIYLIYTSYTSTGTTLVWKKDLAPLTPKLYFSDLTHLPEINVILVKIDDNYVTFNSLEEYINYTPPVKKEE